MKASKKKELHKKQPYGLLNKKLMAAACLSLFGAFAVAGAGAADLTVYGAGGGGGGENGGGGAGAVVEYNGMPPLVGPGGTAGSPLAHPGTSGAGFDGVPGLPFIAFGGQGGDGANTLADQGNGELLIIHAHENAFFNNITIRGGQGGYMGEYGGSGGDSGPGQPGGAGGTSSGPSLAGLGGDVAFVATNLSVGGDIHIVSGASGTGFAIPAGNVEFSVVVLEAVGTAAQNFDFYSVPAVEPGTTGHAPQTKVEIENLIVRNHVNLSFHNIMADDEISVGDLQFAAHQVLALNTSFNGVSPGNANNLRLGGYLWVEGPGAILDMRGTPLNWDSRGSVLIFDNFHPGLAGQTMLTHLSGGGSLLMEDAEVFILPRSANEDFVEGERIALIEGQLDAGSGLAYYQSRAYAGATYYDFDLFVDDASLEAAFVKRHTEGSDPITYGHGLEAATMFARARGEAVADTLVNSLPRSQGPFTFAALSGGHLKGGPGRKMTVDSGFMAAGLGYGFEGDGVYSAIGAFFDYGFGNWRARNQSAEVLRTPKGDLSSYGGGVIGRLDFDALGLRLDGSLAYGRLKSDLWATSDLLDHAASYDHRSNYWNAHLALRKLFAITANHGVELNAAGLFAWQDSDSFTTSFDERVQAAAVNSVRTRLGARYVYASAAGPDAGKWNFYVGGAWEKEYEGQNDLKINGHKVTYNNALKGDTGLGEIGLKWSSASFVIDLTGTGRVGDTRGYGGTVALGIFF